MIFVLISIIVGCTIYLLSRINNLDAQVKHLREELFKLQGQLFQQLKNAPAPLEPTEHSAPPSQRRPLAEVIKESLAQPPQASEPPNNLAQPQAASLNQGAVLNQGALPNEVALQPASTDLMSSFVAADTSATDIDPASNIDHLPNIDPVPDIRPAPSIPPSAQGAPSRSASIAQNKPRARPVAPRTPTALENLFAAVTGFFTQGNPIVRVGMVIMFFGVSFLVKYAAGQGLFPIELRLTGVLLVAATLLVFGWKTRERPGGYGLVLQGGGIAVIYLTLFAAAKLYGLIPLGVAFGLLFCVVLN